MTDPRAQDAFDKARKEGRVLTNQGVNFDALNPVPARALVPDFVPSPARESFARRIFQAKAEHAKNEAAWQSAVIEYARACGAKRIAHFRPAKVVRGGVEKYETPIAEDGKGFLDLEIVLDRLLKVELKFGNNVASDEQLEWLAAYEEAGVEAYVWWPNNWPAVVEVFGRNKQ